MVELISDKMKVSLDAENKTVEVKRVIIEKYDFSEYERSILQLESQRHSTSSHIEGLEKQIKGLKAGEVYGEIQALIKIERDKEKEKREKALKNTLKDKS